MNGLEVLPRFWDINIRCVEENRYQFRMTIGFFEEDIPMIDRLIDLVKSAGSKVPFSIRKVDDDIVEMTMTEDIQEICNAMVGEFLQWSSLSYLSITDLFAAAGMVGLKMGER